MRALNGEWGGGQTREPRPVHRNGACRYLRGPTCPRANTKWAKGRAKLRPIFASPNDLHAENTKSSWIVNVPVGNLSLSSPEVLTANSMVVFSSEHH